MAGLRENATMAEVLKNAMTGFAVEREWLRDYEIRRRFSDSKRPVQLDSLKNWLDDLVERQKIETKIEDGKVFYRLIETRCEKAIESPNCDIAAPPRKEWPAWVKEKFEAMSNENDELHAANHSFKIRLEELEQAIMTHKTEQNRAVSIYGSKNALEELTMQVSLSPKFADLSASEHRHVASTGLMSGLNPEFHLHAWKQTKRAKVDGTWQEVEVLTIMPDYKALIATAPDPIMTSERRLSAQEMVERGIPQAEIDLGAIGYEVTGTNLKHAIMARKAGITYTPFKGFGWWAAMKEVDNWVGVKGNRKKDGTKIVPNDTANGRDGAWMAKKRAIRDLFNQISDLRLKFGPVQGGAVVDDTWEFTGDPNAIEGEFIEREPDGWNTSDDAIQKAENYRDAQGVTDDEVNAALGCDDWRTSPITADEWKIIVDQIAVKKQLSDATIDDIEASMQGEESAAPEVVPVPDDTEPIEIDGITGEVLSAADSDDNDDGPGKCTNCNEAATGAGPFPALCEKCAKKSADYHAANQES